MIHWDPQTEVRLQLWDIAGQERFGNMTRVYYKEAVGAFVVFDLTRLSTFETVAQWKADIDAKVTWGADNRPIPVVLLANKCDLAKEAFCKTPQEMDAYCQEHGFIGWYETSAKDNKVKIIIINNDINKQMRVCLTSFFFFCRALTLLQRLLLSTSWSMTTSGLSKKIPM